METAPFKDRKGLIVTAGIFQILLGIACLLLAGLQILGLVFSQVTADYNRMMMVGAVMAIVYYVILFVLNAWLGIGAIRVRKWARALNLAMGWLWLICFAAVFIMMPFVLSGIQVSPSVGGASWIITLIVMLIMGMLVLIPLFFVLVFGSRHVRATFEARDPHPRWTDRVPVVVLAGLLVLVSLLVSYLQNILMGPIFFLFGSLLTGWVAVLLNLLMFGLFGAVILGLYRLRFRAWVACLVLVCLNMISYGITFMTGGLEKYYELLGYTDDMLAQIERMGITNTTYIGVAVAVGAVVTVSYLFAIRKYFEPGEPNAQSQASH